MRFMAEVVLPAMVTNSTDTITNRVGSLIRNLHAMETYFFLSTSVYSAKQTSLHAVWLVFESQNFENNCLGANMEHTYTRERESESERNRNIWMDGWRMGEWLDTTEIFFVSDHKIFWTPTLTFILLTENTEIHAYESSKLLHPLRFYGDTFQSQN